MSGPTTEVLNEDLKDLKREVHEGFDVQRRDFLKVAVELAELRGELKVTFRIANFAGALLVTSILTSGAAGLWWASALNAKVAGLSERMDERFKATDVRLDERFRAIDVRLDERFKASNVRLDRLEAAITKFIEQGRPAQPTTKAEDGALKK